MAKKAAQRGSIKDGGVDSSSQVEVGVIRPRAKRTSCPGVRLIGGRIYDSSLGKTCHQCRQKTLDFAASCKNLRKGAPCPIRFCHKCLLNRYGEKAEEVEASNDWLCPKCRGICNCSCCMKKRGHEPTGALVLQAKASGFSSVSEMMKAKVQGDGLEGTGVSQKKGLVIVASRINKGKEKSLDRSRDLGLHGLDVPLPQGANLTVVGGMDVPPQLVGDTLQFLEFCAAFGEMLDIKRGQPEAIIREIVRGCHGRTEKHSLVVQFQRQLLSLILEDSGKRSPSDDKDSWFRELGQFMSESKWPLKELPSDWFERGGYDKFDLPKKLKLLNFLCDETLGIASTRTWIQDQYNVYLEKRKEAKGKIDAARDKAKKMKQKLKDEVAKALIARNGAPLSISEHEDIVSKIKIDADQAHVELLRAMDIEPKNKKFPDAVRIEPIIVDDNGRVYWNLKSYSCEPHILLQVMEFCDAVERNENWFIYTLEQQVEMEKYIALLRANRYRQEKALKVLPEFMEA